LAFAGDFPWKFLARITSQPWLQDPSLRGDFASLVTATLWMTGLGGT
jgi:hypothetical protein